MHPFIANNSVFQSVFSLNLSYIIYKVSEFFIQKIGHCLWYEKNVYVLFLYFFFQIWYSNVEVSWQFYKLKMCFGYEQIENELEASYVRLVWQ